MTDQVILETRERVGPIEIIQRIYAGDEPPEGFEWINKPVVVHGEGFQYRATCLCSFPKINGKILYIVEEHGRIFIQRKEQLRFLVDDQETYKGYTFYRRDDDYVDYDFEAAKPGKASIYADDLKTLREHIDRRIKQEEDELAAISAGIGPSPEDPVSQTIGEALEIQYKRERMSQDDPLGR